MVTNWFSGVIIWKLVDGKLHFLVQDSKESGKETQTKFPGGNSKDHPEDEDHTDTIRRELFEETYLRIREDIIPQIIHTPGPKGDHQKSFFLIKFDSLQGEMRTEPIVDGESVLSPPRWLPAEGIEVYRTHKRAARKAVRQLKRTPLLFME